MAYSGSRLTDAPRSQARAPGVPDFEEIFSGLPGATLLLDGAGRIVHANPACEQLLNLSERALRSLALDEVLVPPAGYAERKPELGFAAFDIELALVRGASVRVDFAEALLPEHPGWRIVTLHRASGGRRLAHRIDGAGGARAAVGAAAMLAHEIKNPLSGIRGAAQLLGRGAQETEELTTLITDEVDRIAELIDRMEDFTDTRPMKLDAANIYPLMAHVRQVAQAGFARDIVIEERFDPSLPEVLIDRDAFVQVLLNLLKNACEACAAADAPNVAIATAYRHGMSIEMGAGLPRRPLPIEISIIDNGPGAPRDIVDHLFEPFVSGKPEGKGLGLPLVDKLVRAMGGIVQYARDDGDDPHTVLRLLLPRARP